MRLRHALATSDAGKGAQSSAEKWFIHFFYKKAIGQGLGFTLT